MRLHVRAIGRVRKGPERELIDDYRARAEALGRSHALTPVDELELEPKRAGRAGEADALLTDISSGDVLVALDERGAAWSSSKLATRLRDWRDDGRRCTTFVIGGADGLADTVRDRADTVVAFGPQTWPHRLARVMLFEQLYRAVSIIGGTPYHRE